MAKSIIIKELANSSIDTSTALKRAKVLLSELGEESLEKWVDYELTGYPDNTDVPKYRIVSGNIVGTYLVGNLKCENVSIPLGNMDEEHKRILLDSSFRESAAALQSLASSSEKNHSQLGTIIPADFYSYISHCNDNRIGIVSAKVIFGHQNIDNIIASIENRLLDIFLILEKEFGLLDELDLDIGEKTQDEIGTITQQINYIIYNDNSIKMGDGNNVEKASISTSK